MRRRPKSKYKIPVVNYVETREEPGHKFVPIPTRHRKQTAILGPLLTGLRKFSAENRFTMGVLPCKLVVLHCPVAEWQGWDVTVTCPLADSYVAGAAREAGSAAELAAAHKEDNIPALTADTYLNPLR